MVGSPQILQANSVWSLSFACENDCPLVMTNIAIEHGHRNSEFSHEKLWFSRVMLVYQTVVISTIIYNPKVIRYGLCSYPPNEHIRCKKPGFMDGRYEKIIQLEYHHTSIEIRIYCDIVLHFFSSNICFNCNISSPSLVQLISYFIPNDISWTTFESTWKLRRPTKSVLARSEHAHGLRVKSVLMIMDAMGTSPHR